MSDELVLTDNEFGLFEMMRDGVITNLVKVSHKPDLWRCTTDVANETSITLRVQDQCTRCVHEGPDSYLHDEVGRP